MTPQRRTVFVHFALVVVIATMLTVGIAYPFLPGRYDRLAVPISTMLQVFGLLGLTLVPGGLLWLVKPKFGFLVAVLSTVIGTGVTLVLALFATLSVGNAFGILTITAWLCVLVLLLPKLGPLRRADREARHPAPLYLACLPLAAMAAQLALGAPLSRASRDRAISGAHAFIADIEQYHASHGRYPVSLQAQNRDYRTGVVGTEGYLYAPQGDSYNLSFEQPRFLLDRFGTREWIVYNPHDTHRVYSHAAWLLPPPDVVAPSQGWYASRQTGHAHWMSFLFD